MKPRIRFIEGLRGVMAVSVIVHHFIYFYFPDMVIHGMSRAGDLFAATPLNFFVNGKVAVHYFFLISGFLILYNIEDRIGFSAYLKRVFFRILKILCMVVPAVLFSSFLLRLGFANTLIQSYPYGIIQGLLLPQPSFSSVFTDIIRLFINTCG